MEQLLKKLKKRRPSDDDKPNGYLESDIDWMENNREILIAIMTLATEGLNIIS